MSKTKTSSLPPTLRRGVSTAKLNALFAAMTPVQQRKAIAADALARLARRQLKPATSKWVSFPRSFLKRTNAADLQTVLRRKDAVGCEVCALGGVLCGLAAYEDKIELKRGDAWLDGTYDVESVLYINLPTSSGAPLFDRVAAIFGANQMALIEWVFENGEGHIRGVEGTFEGTTREAATAFYLKHKTPRARFKAIFAAIIAHPDGLFVP